MKKVFSPILALTMVLVLVLLVSMPVLAANPGAIWTSNVGGIAVNNNIYEDKEDVYLNGGPKNKTDSGLPDGDYYVKVTAPNGTLLGISDGATVTVIGGLFGPDKLWLLVNRASAPAEEGYDNTPNNGGEYKVWVSQDETFPNNASKTDNFKVRIQEPPPPPPPPC